MSRKWLTSVLAIAFVLSALTSVQGDGVTQAKRELYQALKQRDEQGTEKAIKSLAGIGGDRAVRVLLKLAVRFPAGEQKLYWMLMQGATSFRDPGAMKEIKKYFLRYRRKGFARDLLFALSHNDSPEVHTVLETVLDRGTYELKLMAIDHLSEIKHPKSVDLLLAAWKDIRNKKGKETMKKRIARALAGLTGESMGVMYENWKSWWAQNRSRGLKGGKKGRPRTGTVVDGMGNSRRSEFEELKTLPKERIVVIKGSPCAVRGVDHNFDHIEETLEQLGVPHTVVTKKDFNDSSFSLKGRMIIFINCSLSWGHCVCASCKAGGGVTNRLQQCTGCDKHDIREDKLSQDAIKKLKKFAAVGGYIFTEDYVLKEFIAKAWPRMIRSGPKTTKEMTVNILPARFQSSHSYLRGIFGHKKKSSSASGNGRGTVTRSTDEALEKIKHTWKIDRESPAIKIVNKYKVTKLLTSPKLGKEAKGNDAVAVTFTVSRRGSGRRVTGRLQGEVSEMRGGRVLHVISHFGKQKSSDDEFTLQNLLVNFMVEAKERYQHRSVK